MSIAQLLQWLNGKQQQQLWYYGGKLLGGKMEMKIQGITAFYSGGRAKGRNCTKNGMKCLKNASF